MVEERKLKTQAISLLLPLQTFASVPKGLSVSEPSVDVRIHPTDRGSLCFESRLAVGYSFSKV